MFQEWSQLSFRENDIGPIGAQLVARGLHSHAALTSLEYRRFGFRNNLRMSENQFGDVGAVALAAVAATMPRLETLE